jgi:hypothetical protein
VSEKEGAGRGSYNGFEREIEREREREKGQPTTKTEEPKG